MSGSEFSRPVRAHEVGKARAHQIGANADERAALAVRFDLTALNRLEADLELGRTASGIRLAGRIRAAGSQPCVRTGTPVPFTIDERLALRLLEAAPVGDEIELSAEDLDSEPLVGDIIDLGEYAAQALALALDPYPRSTAAAPLILSEDEARAAASPFAVLKGR
jgi:uncharacterized metal-binding protein YceD (DUF177 family)